LHEKAASKVAEVRAEAELRDLGWTPEHHPYDPSVAWPVRVPHSFRDMEPEYYGLPEREELFEHLFGFSC
jgi:hypothetical protein